MNNREMLSLMAFKSVWYQAVQECGLGGVEELDKISKELLPEYYDNGAPEPIVAAFLAHNWTAAKIAYLLAAAQYAAGVDCLMSEFTMGGGGESRVSAEPEIRYCSNCKQPRTLAEFWRMGLNRGRTKTRYHAACCYCMRRGARTTRSDIDADKMDDGARLSS